MNDLLQQFKKSKSERSDELNLRLHRSISWLTKAEQASDDLDIEFITLWISFNAVYAKEWEFDQAVLMALLYLHWVG